MSKHSHKYITVIIYSCLTRKAVWLHQGTTKEAARLAYWKACKREHERVRSSDERSARRAANINHLINECLAEKPITEELTQEQREAVMKLQSISRKYMDDNMDFYNHIVEEKRRRQTDREIRRKMREREKITERLL